MKTRVAVSFCLYVEWTFEAQCLATIDCMKILSVMKKTLKIIKPLDG